MDDSGHRENGRHKPPQGQWLMQHQPSMKQIMAIMSERDAAIQERNLAVSEKKAALAERDIAILQRDSAIAERNNAIIERDNAIATLHYHRENSSNNNPCPPGCQISRGVKHMHHPNTNHHHQHQHHMIETTPYNTNRDEMPQIPETTATSSISPEPPSSVKRLKRANETKKANPSPKVSKKVKREEEEVNNKSAVLFGKCGSGWKDQEIGLNQVAFDETTMPVPVCSCTGALRPCYKWGNGGWQSSCCTTNLSVYPLPAVPNKRHARVGGRKMSGSAFNKLLSRLAGEGYDLTNPVDLKDHWAKHGTNRYITIK